MIILGKVRPLSRRLAQAHPQVSIIAPHPTGVTYRLDDGAKLQTVAEASMDGVTAALSLNNIPDLVPPRRVGRLCYLSAYSV
jgi:hypothetical protein